MKKKIWRVGTLLFFFLNIAIIPAEPAQLIDRLIAVVNGEIITQRQLEKEMTLIKNEWGLQDEKKLREIALERIITERLLLQEAKKEGVIIDSQTVEKAIFEIKGQIPDKAFEKMLKEKGLSLEEFREKIRSDLLRGRLIACKAEEIDKEIKISEKELREFYLELKGLKDDNGGEIGRFCRRYQDELIKFKDREEITLEDLRGKIESFLRERKRENFLQDWMERLRSEAEIKII